ncbi:MAG: isopenicillin N synthase family oxygenase [Pseudomonadales bacterium]|nr:isopenicillin N synthase family oxygenase [Pseudomonadales bacterium]
MMNKVPVIDLQNADDNALMALDAACRDHGFFLLKGHGLESLAAQMWQSSAEFFSLPYEQKASVMRTESYPLGYYDRELTKRKRDQKEVFDFFVPAETSRFEVIWPAGLTEFRQALESFHNGCTSVAVEVMALLARALDLDDAAFQPSFARGHSSTTRINHYPPSDPVPADQTDALNPLGETALGEHTDPGAITLLFQDDVGGLQAWSRTDGWIDVPPVKGTLVLNLGDMMQVWTNERYRSALHRVVRHPAGRSRYSTPFFYNPHNSAVVQPLAAFGEPRFSPIGWYDYIGGRVTDNYRDIGEDDIQIERFRIAAG